MRLSCGRCNHICYRDMIDQWSVDKRSLIKRRSFTDQSQTGRNKIARVTDRRLFADLWANKPFQACLLEMPKRRSAAGIALKLITKTYLYNVDPLKPHFYIVNLGFTGVFINFLIFAQNKDCGYSLEPPRRGGSNEYQQSMFWAKTLKISDFFIWKFSFFLW